MKNKRIALCLALTLPVFSFADTLTPDYNAVDEVTVFLDRAEVTRKLDVELRKGVHSIEVNGLPAQLIESSLRTSGEGPKGLRIGSVEIRRAFGVEAAQEQERMLRAKLQAMNDENSQLDGTVQALDTQAAFIQRLASYPSEKDQQDNRAFTPEKWPTAWQAIGQGMAETNNARIAAKHKIRSVQQQIHKLEEELRQIQTGRRDTLTALLHVEAATAGKARFTLSYQLPNATWSPSYDAHLTTANGEVELRQVAHVRQSSGEAWNNVSLTVSTARPSAGAVMPELSPWWIDFARPAPVASRLHMEKQATFADGMVAGAMAPEAPALQEAEEVVASSQASEFSLRYRIPGRVSVPADNSRQRYLLEKQQFTTSLGARTTPRRDPRAFLYAEFDFPGTSPLLAGSWQLQRDGVYVGNARQPALRPGEKVALAFGPDDAIKVEYQLLKDQRAEKGLLNREQRIERNYRITISNGHQRVLPVTVYDQIPVARDKSISIALTRNSTPPTTTDVDQRSGVLNWVRELNANDTFEIDFGYSVSYPHDKRIPDF